MTDSPNSLYTTWFSALPEAFRAMVPNGAAAAAPVADRRGAANDDVKAPPLSFPVDQVANAMNQLDGMLTQLYQAYLPMLAKGKISAEPLQAMADKASESFEQLLATLASPLAAMPTINGLAQGWQPWASMLHGLVPSAAGQPAANELQLGIERTFGGLAEAFGLGPMRELEEALRRIAASSAAKQRAQLEYLAVAAQAWKTGTQGLIKELQAMGERGERIESLLGFIRLWAKSIDLPMHAAMQDARGLEVTAKVLRAANEHREQVQKAIAIASEALHVPTRADMDDAFREIQELKREVRRLKKSLPAAARKASVGGKESA